MKRIVAALVCAAFLVVDAPSVAALDLTPRCRVTRAAEFRPMNIPFNYTVTGRAPAGPWPTWAFDDSTYRAKVDGNHVGSTDELLRWAACKWGVPADVLRGVAVQESWWDATTRGDAGASYGLMQIKVGAPGHPGVTVAEVSATAWNVDYYGATLRACLDGHMVLWRDRPDLTSRPYRRGDLWGCVEAWYTGVGPTTWSAWYSDRVRTYVAQRRWDAPDFVAWTGWVDWCAAATPLEAAVYWNCRN